MTVPCLQYSHRLRAGSLGKLSQPVIGTYHRRERHSRAGSGERKGVEMGFCCISVNTLFSKIMELEIKILGNIKKRV